MQNFKKLLVIYQGDDWYKKIPFDNKANRAAYEAWANFARTKDAEMVRASTSWFDERGGFFRKYWIFEDNIWKKKEEEYRPDVILNKVKIREKALDAEMMKNMQIFFPLVNNPIFASLFDNKINQYLLFGEFMPKSFFADRIQSLERELKKRDSDEMVVLKPIDQSGGFGIVIDKVKNIKVNKFLYPVLGQEFLEAKADFLDLQDQVADLRMVFVGDKLSYACSRLAAKGSLFTNFHQGAVLRIVERDKIPAEIWEIVEKVNTRISFFEERIYSLDFLYDKVKGPKLLEMNTKPGVDYFNKDNFNIREKYFKDVLEAIESWLKKC